MAWAALETVQAVTSGGLADQERGRADHRVDPGLIQRGLLERRRIDADALCEDHNVARPRIGAFSDRPRRTASPPIGPGLSMEWPAATGIPASAQIDFGNRLTLRG